MAKSKMKKIALTTMAKVVIADYIRVSTDKQREEGYSIDIQKERLRAYAKTIDLQPNQEIEIREYIDDGFSGGSLERPAMSRLIEDVKNREITHVVVIKLDRLSRSQKDTLYLIEDVFLPNGVAFISLGESFNTATPFGRAVVGILSVFAQLERENIFERTRSGMQKRVELGYWPGGGRTPFGYDYDENQGILVPNKDADTVRQVYDLYLRGYAMQAIADICGLKYDRLAQQILTRKSNIGVITYNGVEYKGRHQAIVSPEIYHAAMAMMAERSAKRFVSATEHLLTGLVYCGCCGSKMRYQKWGKAGHKFVCYSQQKSKAYLVKDPDCKNHKPWADDVENIVLDTIFQRAKAKVEADEQEVQMNSVRQILEEQKNDLIRKLKRLYDLYADSSDDVLLDTITDLKKELSHVEKKITIELERAAITDRAQETQERLSTVQECWVYMTISEKQNILRSAINKIIITNNHVHVDFNY